MSQESSISWFHGKVTRQAAEEILKKHGQQEGLFLVRESSTATGDYSLSLIFEGLPVHYQIRRHGEDALFNIDEGPIFHGLEELIEHYQHEANGLVTQLGEMCKGKPPPAESRRHGKTNLLHRATKEGNFTVVDELLKSGYSSIDAKTQDGDTALHLASRLGKDDILKRLIIAGANVNAFDSEGFTPLHYACQMNRPTTVRVLVDAENANIQAITKQDGLVAMHIASIEGNIECIKALLALNAPCRPRTAANEIPYDLAVQHGHTACAELLKDYQTPFPKTTLANWLHNNITREEAMMLLQEHGDCDGAFLVRRSTHKPGVFVLSMVHNHQTYNYEILEKDNYFYIDNGPYLESLEHLVAHYMKMPDGLRSRLEKAIKPGGKYRLPAPIGNIQNNTNRANGNYENTNSITTTIREGVSLCLKRDSIQLGTLIGEGETGSVYEGIWTDGGEKMPVAVKTLRSEHLHSNNCDAFLREADIMLTLNHHCIVRLLGICIGPPLMMIQELLPMGSMLNYLLKCPQEIQPTIELQIWAAQIADGMRYLESKRFVHRDLAARNILLFSKEKAKIADFGLSRTIGKEHDYYKASQGGKWPVKWYAPESVYYGSFSHASDVWSFGVTLWEMYSYGQQPYDDMMGTQVMECLDRGERLEKPDMCPEAVYSIMRRCWAYSAKERLTFEELFQFFDNL